VSGDFITSKSLRDSGGISAGHTHVVINEIEKAKIAPTKHQDKHLDNSVEAPERKSNTGDAPRSNTVSRSEAKVNPFVPLNTAQQAAQKLAAYLDTPPRSEGKAWEHSKKTTIAAFQKQINEESVLAIYAADTLKRDGPNSVAEKIEKFREQKEPELLKLAHKHGLDPNNFSETLVESKLNKASESGKKELLKFRALQDEGDQLNLLLYSPILARMQYARLLANGLLDKPNTPGHTSSDNITSAFQLSREAIRLDPKGHVAEVYGNEVKAINERFMELQSDRGKQIGAVLQSADLAQKEKKPAEKYYQEAVKIAEGVDVTFLRGLFSDPRNVQNKEVRTRIVASIMMTDHAAIEYGNYLQKHGQYDKAMSLYLKAYADFPYFFNDKTLQRSVKVCAESLSIAEKKNEKPSQEHSNLAVQMIDQLKKLGAPDLVLEGKPRMHMALEEKTIQEKMLSLKKDTIHSALEKQSELTALKEELTAFHAFDSVQEGKLLAKQGNYEKAIVALLKASADLPPGACQDKSFTYAVNLASLGWKNVNASPETILADFSAALKGGDYDGAAKLLKQTKDVALSELEQMKIDQKALHEKRDVLEAHKKKIEKAADDESLLEKDRLAKELDQINRFDKAVQGKNELIGHCAYMEAYLSYVNGNYAQSREKIGEFEKEYQNLAKLPQYNLASLKDEVRDRGWLGLGNLIHRNKESVVKGLCISAGVLGGIGAATATIWTGPGAAITGGATATAITGGLAVLTGAGVGSISYAGASKLTPAFINSADTLTSGKGGHAAAKVFADTYAHTHITGKTWREGAIYGASGASYLVAAPIGESLGVSLASWGGLAARTAPLVSRFVPAATYSLTENSLEQAEKVHDGLPLRTAIQMGARKAAVETLVLTALGPGNASSMTREGALNRAFSAPAAAYHTGRLTLEYGLLRPPAGPYLLGSAISPLGEKWRSWTGEQDIDRAARNEKFEDELPDAPPPP